MSKRRKLKQPSQHHEAIRAAKSAGLFLLVEGKPGDRDGEIYTLYDAQGTGKPIGQYYPKCSRWRVNGITCRGSFVDCVKSIKANALPS